MQKYLKISLAVLMIGLVLWSSVVFAQVDPGEEANEECKHWWQFGCHLRNVVNWGALLIGKAIAYIAGLLIMLAASFIQVLIKLSGELTSNILVTTGFKISLSLANLGFVLAIIVIAFTTILRLPGYETKQLLWKLIVAALLVNFSLTIAGVIIDFNNVLAFFFIDAAAPDDISKFSDNMANSLNLQKLGLSEIKSENLAGGVLYFGGGFLPALASISITAIFSVILVIVFFATALMILVRNIYLMLLLVVMPVVWLLWIFPQLSHLWTKWWNVFLKWNFFLPAATFFIYLSILSSEQIGISVAGHSGGLASTAAVSNLTDFTTNTIVVYLQILVQVGILVGGLIMASSMGIYGAQGALGAAQRVKGWAIGAAGKVAKAPVKYAGTRPMKAGARGLATALSSRGLRWIPGAKGAAGALAGVGARKGEIEEYQKKNLANLTDKQFASYQKTLPPWWGPVARAAVLAEAAKRKTMGEFSTDQLKQLATAAKQTNPGVPVQSIPAVKEIFKNMPSLAPDLIDMKKYIEVTDEKGNVIATRLPDVARYEAIKDTVQKHTTGEALSYSTQALKNIDVVLSLSNAKLGAIAASGSDKQREAILKTFDEAEKLAIRDEKSFQKYADSAARIREYVNANPGLQSKTIAGATPPGETKPPSPPPTPTPPKT